MEKKKSFDCVDMKHEGAAIIQAKLEGMSREEQLAYWQKRTNELKEFQRKAIRRKRAS